MYLRTQMASFAGKSIRHVLLALKKSRGETAPGLAALSIDPDYIKHCQKHYTTRIIISGTNGKTTTTGIMADILKHQNISFVTNPSGSNLLRGIASALLTAPDKASTVLWEADEAALIPIARQTLPTHLVITNLFRDQLDRYGEIDTTFKKWLSLLETLPRTTVILNGDDPNLAYLGKKVEKRHTVIYFGLSQSNKKTKLDDSADALFCPVCNRELNYSYITFSHLGNYSCSCGFKRPQLTYQADAIEIQPQQATFTLNGKRIIIPLTGFYNVYNALAALTLADQLHFDIAKAHNVLQSFTPKFGRQEKRTINGKTVQLMLVKNPTGFNQVIDTLKTINKRLTLCIAINDRIADGKDVSWLWDVDFERLLPLAKHIIVTGDRALDMGLRLKYAGFTDKQYQVITHKVDAVTKLLESKDTLVYLLPTYTALWETEAVLDNL